jgi:anti-sigma B factor antagonist
MLPEVFDVAQTGSLVTVTLRQREITHPELQDAIVECAERIRYHNAQNFLFDLEGVEFLSSACLGVLVGFLQEVEHARGKIVLANCHDNVAFLFRVTRLDAVFEIFDDTTAAAASL